MELPESLINEFANVVSPRVDRTNNETVVYGTVKTVDGKTAMVQLDGSDTVTPCVMSMLAEQGDRVRVSIKDHKAVVTGNVTNPATVAKADKYMKFTDEGLVIGGVNEAGQPTGFYILISNDTYYIKDQNGKTVASFASSEVNLASGEGTVSTENGTLYLKGTNAVGLRSSKKSYSAEVVAVDRSSDPSSPMASMQVMGKNGTSSVIVNSDGDGTISINTPVAYGDGERADLLLNGSPLYNANNLFVRAGLIIRNVSLSAYQTRRLSLSENNSVDTPGIPSNYCILGISNFYVKDSNSGSNDTVPTVKLVGFSYGFGGVLGSYNGGLIYVYNEKSSAITVDIYITCFALPSGGVRDGGTTYIDF